MPTRNINLTPEWDRFVAERVKDGRYANASEVMRAGLRALEEDEKEDEAKLEALRAAIQAGDESPALDGPAVMEEILERLRQRPEKRSA